jgi:hypothetical protein
MILAIMAAGALALLPADAGGGAKEVFRALSPDGRLVTVWRSGHLEYFSPTADQRAALPKEMVPAAGGRVTTYEYVALVRKDSGPEIVLWRKRHSVPELLAGTLLGQVVVHDIALHGDSAAILYSDWTVNVDIVGKEEDGQYSVRSTEELFAQDSAKALGVGRLVWLTALYALVETTTHEDEIWLIEPGHSRMVVRR